MDELLVIKLGDVNEVTLGPFGYVIFACPAPVQTPAVIVVLVSDEARYPEPPPPPESYQPPPPPYQPPPPPEP